MRRRTNLKETKPNNEYYHIKHELFWSVSLALLGAFFATGIYVGSTKFDKNLIDLSESNQSLLDTLRNRENTIRLLRVNSDSALSVLSHIPYGEMNLTPVDFRKVQTTIENAGHFLILNK